MRKIILTLGLLLGTGSLLAGVDCEQGINPCQFPDPMFGNAPQPAVFFVVLEDQVVDTAIDIWSGPDCQGDPSSSVGPSLDLPPGQHNVFLRFNPPLAPGTVMSVNWQIGDCDPTGCINYIIGSDPDFCPQEAQAVLSSPASVIE